MEHDIHSILICMRILVAIASFWSGVAIHRLFPK